VERAAATLRQQLSSASDDGGLVDPVESAPSPDPDGVVARLLAQTPYARWPALASQRELQNVSALDQLSRQFVARAHRVPFEALSVAELAVKIAEALSATYPEVLAAQLRAHALKNHATALRLLARYREALLSFERAEELLRPFEALDHLRALVRLGRASALQEMGRAAEASPLLRDCGRILEKYGDRRGQLLCGISEGALLHRTARYREACDVYASLLPLANEVGDLEALASVHNNIAHSAIEIGDFSLAELHVRPRRCGSGGESICPFTWRGRSWRVDASWYGEATSIAGSITCIRYVNSS